MICMGTKYKFISCFHRRAIGIMTVKEPGNTCKIHRVMLNNGEATGTDKERTITNIAFVLHPAIPLAFVFNKFNIIITLCSGCKSSESESCTYQEFFQGQIICIKVIKFYQN